MNRILALWAILGFAVSAAPPLRGVAQQTTPDPLAPSATSTDPSNQSSPPNQLLVNGQEVGHRVESRDDEICLTCGKPISKDDVTYLVEGQRVPVHKGACVGALAAKPVEWLSKLKPRGAFLDAGAATLGLSSGWLLLGSYVLVGLIFSALAAHRAFSVGRDPLTWLVIGLFTSIFGYAVLLLLPRQEVHAVSGVPTGLAKVATTYSPESCPACGADNHPSARICSGCGKALTPRIDSEVRKAGLVHG